MPPELVRIAREDYEDRQEAWDALQYLAECRYAPPADDTRPCDADIEDMSLEEIEAEIAAYIFAVR